MPPDCLPLKLRPVRRAHNLTVDLLPESIVKKRTEETDPKLANSISYLELASCDSRFWRLPIMRLGARIARLEQRRKMQATKRFPEACTCFPADEQPGFKWRAEAEIAAAVLCPLHGLRFHIVITRDLYRAFRFYITDYKDGWPRQSAQYQKAMRTSFDWALWPPQKEKDKEFGQDSVLILRDGTELPSGGS